MTAPLDIPAIRKLLDGVTEGPWRMLPGCGWGEAWAEYFGIKRDETIGWPIASDSAIWENGKPKKYVAVCVKSEDQEFITAARTLVPQLCDEVERLTKALAPFAMMNPLAPPRDVNPLQWARDVNAAARIAELEAKGERK